MKSIRIPRSTNPLVALEQKVKSLTEAAAIDTAALAELRRKVSSLEAGNAGQLELITKLTREKLEKEELIKKTQAKLDDITKEHRRIEAAHRHIETELAKTAAHREALASSILEQGTVLSEVKLRELQFGDEHTALQGSVDALKKRLARQHQLYLERGMIRAEYDPAYDLVRRVFLLPGDWVARLATTLRNNVAYYPNHLTPQVLEHIFELAHELQGEPLKAEQKEDLRVALSAGKKAADVKKAADDVDRWTKPTVLTYEPGGWKEVVNNAIASMHVMMTGAQETAAGPAYKVDVTTPTGDAPRTEAATSTYTVTAAVAPGDSRHEP